VIAIGIHRNCKQCQIEFLFRAAEQALNNNQQDMYAFAMKMIYKIEGKLAEWDKGSDCCENSNPIH